MRYADVTRCPDCRAVLEGRRRCAVCGFDLEAPEVAEIWQHLTRIDELVEQARGRVVEAPPASRPAPPTPPPPAPGPLPGLVPGPPPGGPAAAAGGGVSVGSVLLGLGAALLVVAAIIFVSFAWSVLGIGGRAAILGVLTLAVAGAGTWALRRRLRGSSEALWLVFAGFLSADWFAACGLGLLGLDGLDGWQVAVPWWLLLSGATLAVGAASRRLLEAPVLTLQVVAGIALVPVVATVGAELVEADVRAFWLFAVLTLLAGAVVTIALLSSQHVWAAVAGVVGAATGASMLVAAVVEAATHREVGAYVGDLHGLPLLLVTCAVGALTAWRPARAAAVAGVVLLATLVVALPLVDPLDGQAWFLWVAVVTTAVALLRVVPGLAQGAHAAGLLVAGGVLSALVVLTWTSGLAPLAAVLDAAAEGPGDRDLLLAVPETPDLDRLAAWATAAGGFAIVAILLATARWPEAVARGAARHTVVVAGLVAIVTTGAVLADARVPLIALTASTLVAGLGVVAVARWAGRAWEHVGVGLLLVAPVAVLPVWDALVGAVAVVVALLIALAVYQRRRVEAFVTVAAVAIGLHVLALLVVAHPEVDLAVRPSVTILLAVALSTLVVGVGLSVLPWAPGQVLEGVGGGVAAVALVVGIATGDPAWLATWCTGAGVTAVGVGLLVPSRRWVRHPGSALLGLAWVLRLAASDVRTVEAYTVPFAVVALVVGGLALRRDPATGTVAALGGGLLLALLPSTLVALTDPVSWRALAVGVVAFVVLVGGLALRWQAPFVLGGAVVVLLAVVELAPYGWALPRWVLIGVAGVLLLVGGITWEKRVRDGRAVVRFVRSMR